MASFTLLFLALAVGFIWYERTHPPAKIVALVAALAALAAAGRVAFAPLPNIKPTTDIVLLAGFALGAAPGFAVGAVAAIASNVMFGQGPWTPWQMLAWGLCGLFGAALGRMTHRSLGRWPLAAACGVAGLGFGLIMDFSTWTTYTGAHTLGEFLTISATSLPFNIAHAVGNVLFCLAFGPAFLRALLRYRERFTVRWAPLVASGAVLAGVLVALGGAGPGAPAASAATAHTAASPGARAVAYLRRAQNRDGGFGPLRGRGSTPLYTSWAALGLAAAGVAPGNVRHGGATLAGRVQADAARAQSAGDLERTVLALRAARRSTGATAARLTRLQQRDGSWNHLVNQTAFGVLALRAAGQSIHAPRVRAAGHFLVGQAGRDGGFSYAGRVAASGIDDTASAIQGLVRSGYGRSRTVRRATAYLVARQNLDGGFPLTPGAGSNAQSTSFAVQALVAVGRNPAAVRRRGSRSPIAYLVSLMAADGSVRYSRTSAQTPVWVTAQALLAFARRPF